MVGNAVISKNHIKLTSKSSILANLSMELVWNNTTLLPEVILCAKKSRDVLWASYDSNGLISINFSR